jgi:hypothetical protein
MMPVVGQLCAQEIYNNYMSNKKEKDGSYTEQRWNVDRKSQSGQIQPIRAKVVTGQKNATLANTTGKRAAELLHLMIL